MRIDKFTVKAQEAVARAQELASGQGNPAVTPVHLLAGLLGEREGGIVRPLLEKVGADVDRIRQITDDAKRQLANDGYDPVYGARPLKRLIQQQIENPLAKRILAGDFAPGDAIEINANGEAYAFTKTQPVLEAELLD